MVVVRTDKGVSLCGHGYKLDEKGNVQYVILSKLDLIYANMPL